MSEFLRFQKTPSDAELEADRDAKHQREVQEWFAEHKDLTMTVCDNPHCNHTASDHDGNKCRGEVTDYYGTWECMCRQFEKDPDR